MDLLAASRVVAGTVGAVEGLLGAVFLGGIINVGRGAVFSKLACTARRRQRWPSPPRRVGASMTTKGALPARMDARAPLRDGCRT